MIRGIRFKLAGIMLVSLAVVVKSCRKDPVANSEKQDGVYQTTPYVMERKPWYPAFQLPADNPLTEEGVMLGRMLFHDPIISKDSSISCASCHKQNKAFTDGLRVSKGISGQIGVRNTMALANLMWQDRFFWDGRATTIHDQVLGPIQAHNEMGLDLYNLAIKLEGSARYKPAFKKAFNTDHVTPEVLSKALEQFLVTMVSFNSKIDQLHGRTDTLNVINESALRGLHIFFTPAPQAGGQPTGGADCFHCHGNAPFFSFNGAMFNNGLDVTFADKGFGNVTGNEPDNGRFKAPSLRNIEFTAPYMHDGRFDNLEEVLDFYSDGVKLNSPFLDPNILSHNKQLHLTDQQKADIIEFLKALSDPEFINDPKFKSPF